MLPKDKQAFLGHVRDLAAGTRRSSKAAVVQLLRSSLGLWLKARYPRLPELGLALFIDRRACAEAQAFASWLEGLAFGDATFWLSSAYSKLLAVERRRRQALFFTPPTLAARMIDSLRAHGVRFASARVTDPSCGGSAFLTPVAIEMARALSANGWSSSRILAHVERHLAGFEIDPFLCELSRAFLNAALYEHVCEAGRLLDLSIVQGNALETAPPQLDSYDVVISNPPYRKLDAAEFARLPESFRRVAGGQPNLYALFMDLALRLTARGGVLALLTPAGFFGGRSFGPLRRVLRREANALQVDFIERRTGAFLDVEQETALTVLRKEARRARAISVSVTGDGLTFEPLGSYALPHETTAPWVLPRSQPEVAVVPAYSSSQWDLKAYGYEPRTGFLVPHRMPVKRLKHRGNRMWACPIIWATQIGKDGVHRFKPGRGDHAALFGDVSGYGIDGVLTTPSVALQRTSSKDQSRRVRCVPISQEFVDEHGGYMGENHVCFLVPRVAQARVSVELLAAILNTSFVDRVFRCLSGTATVSAYELNAMPLPDPMVVTTSVAAGYDMEVAVARGYAATYPVEITDKKAA